MQKDIKTLPGGETQITLELSPDEYQGFLAPAAKKISEKNQVSGFRPGLAPYDIIKQKFGEAAILEEALSEIITHTFVKVVTEEKLETVGSPEITIKKMAPGDSLIYEAKISILPKVTLPDLSTIKISRPTINIKDDEIKKLLLGLAKSRAVEILENRPANENDLVKLDYQISVAGVPQENATQKNSSVFLGEHHMVPGFEEQIIGLSAGDHKKFNITFPKDYFQKHFAGKECEFSVSINGVYKLEIPELNDEFAKSLGHFHNLGELEKQIRENLQNEKENEVNRQLENDLLKNIIEKTSFEIIPEKLIANEIHLMSHELEDDLAVRGLDLHTWLSNMNKTEEAFEKDLRPGAELRVKSILIIRDIAQKENITTDKKEIDEEIQKITGLYQDNQENLEQINSPAYRDYLSQSLTSQKVIAWLKEKIVK
ncbi:trigger factor [Candidatus Kuenenbacteria bacterium]|nr:trigger factor [Candidatus Kuenenbacteria bacterium]